MSDLTCVTARLRRSFSEAVFDGLDLPALVDWWLVDGLWTVMFDGLMTDAQVFAAWGRMESVDDVDQARRADLRAATACCAACDLAVAYVLGDDFPPATPPPA